MLYAVPAVTLPPKGRREEWLTRHQVGAALGFVWDTAAGAWNGATMARDAAC
jgi:hypothetical protein